VPVAEDGKVRGNEVCDQGASPEIQGCNPDSSEVFLGYTCTNTIGNTPETACVVAGCGDGYMVETE